MAATVNTLATDADLTALKNDVDQYIGENGVFNVNVGGLTITRGEFQIVMTGDQLQFRHNGDVVAYLSNQKLYITQAQITSDMQIGNFIWKNRDGRLTLMKVT